MVDHGTACLHGPAPHRVVQNLPEDDVGLSERSSWKHCMKLLRDFPRGQNISLRGWSWFFNTRFCRGACSSLSPLQTIPPSPLPVVPLPSALAIRDFVTIPFRLPFHGFHGSRSSVIIWFGQFLSLFSIPPNFPFVPLKSERSNLLLF